MGKKVKKAPPAPSPSRLEMGLSAPGMSLLHRAGLGGLACTLKFIERARLSGELTSEQVPGWPWKDDRPPWQVTATAITLDFGSSAGAGEFLQRLFAAAFQIQDGLIFLPGQYGDLPPSKAVLAELHNALMLTFLQHGNVRALAKQPTVMSYDPDGTGTATLTINFKPCSKYKHQEAWREMVLALSGRPVEVTGPLNPGAVVRHVKFTGTTKIVEVAERILPLHFSLVGCVSLSVNRGVGVLVVPEVADLESFVALRPLMTPACARDCRVVSASDAALQTQIRLRARLTLTSQEIPACQAVTLNPTPWASQQKTRTAVVHVSIDQDLVWDLFEKAMLELPPRVKSREVSEGKGKTRTTRTEFFWADSRIRPLIADNLALGRPWFVNFASLVATPDKAKGVSYERKGLHAMIDKIAWDNAGAETIVKAVHEAIRQRFGRIADENRTNPVARRKRWGREYERWRMAFVGAKTADQFRSALADLWSRAGANAVLKDAWRTALPLLAADRWQLARDLSLVGLASYAGREPEEMEITPIPEEGDTQ